MPNKRYRDGSTLADALGCLSAFVLGIPLLGLGFLFLSLGDCTPGANCWAGWGIIPVFLAITISVGLAVRYICGLILNF
jgi:hypothetical protein